MIENELVNQERDDSKDIVTIDYYDRINKRWIKLDVTKEVARFMRADTQKRRRKQNKYDFHNLPFDEVFDSNKDDNPKNEYLIDENASPDVIMEKKEQAKLDEMMRDEQRTLVENALPILTPTQRVTLKMAFYKNMSYRDIAIKRNVTKAAVAKTIRKAQKNIKNFIENSEN